MRFILPLGLFVVVVGFLAVGLERDPRLVPSPLIGKPLPAFELGSLAAPERPLTRADLDGDIYLLNVWASWCAACRVEHPLLVDLARQGQLQLVGLNYKDELEAARQWLVERGDPYRLSLHDPTGQLGLDLGVYGVPETFRLMVAA